MGKVWLRLEAAGVLEQLSCLTRTHVELSIGGSLRWSTGRCISSIRGVENYRILATFCVAFDMF